MKDYELYIKHADILRKLNEWRRGESDEHPDPKQAGESIDFALCALYAMAGVLRAGEDAE